MKKIFILVVCLPILLATASHAQIVQQQKPVAANGETVIKANSPKFNVRVKIVTHQVNIGKPSDKRSEVIPSRCAYSSRYPCSIVDRIDIAVNGKSIGVPCAALCSVTADLHMAEVRIEYGIAILTLRGGGEPDSFVVKIEFDSKRVLHSALSYGEAEDDPLEETTYHLVIFE
jgi:hypothetical protein